MRAENAALRAERDQRNRAAAGQRHEVLMRLREQEYQARYYALLGSGGPDSRTAQGVGYEDIVPSRKKDDVAYPEWEKTRPKREELTEEEALRVLDSVEQVHRHGFAIVPNVLDPAAIRRVLEGMGPFFESSHRLWEKKRQQQEGIDVRADAKQTIHIQNILAKETQVIQETATNRVLRAVVAGVLSKDFILNAGLIAMDPDPGCAPQGLHRDDGFWPMPRPHLPLVLTCAIALDPFTKENGGTLLIPGSHIWEESRTPDAGYAETIVAEMPVGSMLIWDGAIFHAGGGNGTRDQRRRTLTLNYTRGWLRTQFNQFLSVSREAVLSMPPELQADLGYHHSASGLGGCEFRDPLKYLKLMEERGGDGAQRLLGPESKL